jgi:hypothetical protein
VLAGENVGGYRGKALVDRRTVISGHSSAPSTPLPRAGVDAGRGASIARASSPGGAAVGLPTLLGAFALDPRLGRRLQRPDERGVRLLQGE